MCQHTGPRGPARDAAHAERSGFDFPVIGDHYLPLDSQGHSPNTWDSPGTRPGLLDRAERRFLPALQEI